MKRDHARIDRRHCKKLMLTTRFFVIKIIV